MSKPIIHAISSAKKFGGAPEDYLPIHALLDSSKSTIADNRHRALTHNAWFIGHILPLLFGETFVNSAGKTISTRDIGEQHCLEDNGCIPSAQDYLQEIELKPWMTGKGRGLPPSMRKLEGWSTRKLDHD